MEVSITAISLSPNNRAVVSVSQMQLTSVTYVRKDNPQKDLKLESSSSFGL